MSWAYKIWNIELYSTFNINTVNNNGFTKIEKIGKIYGMLSDPVI